MLNRRFIHLLVFITLLSLLLVTSGFAAENAEVAYGDDSKNFSYNASSQQIEKINRLWGKKMSRAEFIQEAFPEAFAQIPKEVVQNLKKVEMEWPDPNRKPSDSDTVSP